MFRQLDYQDRVLSTLDTYLDLLKEKKARADKVAALAEQDPDLGLAIPDFAKDAWEAMKAANKLPASRAAIPFSPRMDGCERPVPNAVLKVPTGGGKTWLAVSAVSRVMGRYLDRNTGFVLWIVPNEAIYTQTLKYLKDRQHPYRQALDRAAAGRVKIMEKTDRLDARDVESNLCIMLLMLQSANRETQDSLKMFQDRGDVHGFFPPEGEQQAHQAAIDRTPNLSAYTGMFPMVKDSLGNALRIIRPVVVMDEGHRAISDLAFGTLYGFNPCFVLELTATPQDVQPRGGRNPREGRYANVLVEVTGRELDREGMIKMPLNLDPRQGNDWKATLNAALAKLNTLDAKARQLRADTGRYIRPIMLIQVERTGADQRESGHIHAEDVKDWLLTAGFDQAEIAIKTAQQNDLNDPENQDLLSPTNRVRAIITKQALQEGWDCPFAYVLCSLAASSNLKAMTQLVGRILRQPGALKTGVEALDECHVIT
ncbi:MAG: DEAD/DEAH box helicase family protein, partial [Rhodospirillaceae bacterium]|nr:DEAD/DEAH box helicase family protein [Rhodospirillaceae bacterium]